MVRADSALQQKYRDTLSIFTIHNLAYQGTFGADWLPRLDLGWDRPARRYEHVYRAALTGVVTRGAA